MSDRLAWFKSSYSNSDGGDCIEVALSWTKSSYSTTDGGECVEVAASPLAIHVRDSKDKAGPQLSFSPPPGPRSSPSRPKLRLRRSSDSLKEWVGSSYPPTLPSAAAASLYD